MRQPRLRSGRAVLPLLLFLAACSDTTITEEPVFPPTEPIARRDLSGCSVDTPSGCVTVNDGAPAEHRYTLYNVSTAENEGLYLIDGLGNVVRHWETSGLDGEPLPEPGRVISTIERPGPPSFGRLIRFRAPCIAILDWEGVARWPHEAPAGARCGAGLDGIPYAVDDEGAPSADAHHDVHVWGAPVYATPETTRTTGDGRILYLSQGVLSPEQSAAVAGEGAEDVGDEPLVEIAADGKTVLWEWFAGDHVGELGFDEDGRAALATFASGIPLPGFPALPDQGFLLLNAASYLGPNRHCPDPASVGCDHRFHPDNVLVSSRQAALMFIVARHAHPNGEWPEGAIVWRLGPDFAGTPHGPISGQHHPHMIPAGLPGEGNVLVFDNGSGAGFGRDADGALSASIYRRGYSRILEIDPSSGTAVWSYEQPTEGEDGTPRFNAFNLSSSQRLANGNTFIAEGNSGRLFEVTRDGEIVWEFWSPFPPLITLELPVGTLIVNVYRGYRVPPEWVPGPTE